MQYWHFNHCQNESLRKKRLFLYTKAFNRVNHVRMMEILKDIGEPFQENHILINLYWNQQAKIRVGNNFLEEVDILKGVRQGCCQACLISVVKG